MLSLDDTIAAIASAPGGAARGIVRLSGPQAIAVISRCFRPDDTAATVSVIKSASVIPGRVYRRQAIHGPDWEHFELPCDLYVWPTRQSYTRQPVAEIHTLGSPPLLNAVLRTMCDAGARLARPGEF